jgi:uncharacterized membrane protein YgaE (UPF0421/DUF939 family)
VDLRVRLERARSRLDLATFGRIVQSALAAGAAWELALQIPGHGRPFFAPIAAVIGLAAERGRRGRQAINMMIGVAIGILIGAGLVGVAGAGAWQIVVGTLVALVLTTAAGAPPIIRTQAAASAILVVALHRPGANLAVQRLVDALIGGGIAVLLARILFPVDPLELVREQARRVRRQLADALDELAAGLAVRDRARLEAALHRIERIDDGKLEDALALAREVARAAPRRRPLRRRIEALGSVYHELEASVSDARAIGTGALRLVDGPAASPSAAVAAVRVAAEAVRSVEPETARRAADEAQAAARRLRRADASLGAGVVAHGVVAVADHTRRAADAREEDTRLAAAARTRLRLFRVANEKRR